MTDPITVAYVGNFTRSFCTEVHVAASLESLGHRVVRWQENELDWHTVPATVDAEGAHLLMWQRTWAAEMDVVLPELARLRDAGVPSVSYHLDRWFGLDREHQVDDQPFFHTDLVVSPDDSPRWADRGVNHLWMPPGVFDQECGPVAPNPRQWPFDVVFVGSYPYPHPEWADYRHGLVEAFRAAFGSRFRVLPRRGHPIRGRQLQELYATVPVILGDSCLAGESHRYWSDRIPETLGRGGLLIHPEVGSAVGHLGDWYQNDASKAPGGEPGDLMTYELGRYDQAVVLAESALANPGHAQAIRDHGRATVLARDTYAMRMEALLGEVVAQFGPWRDTSAPNIDTAAGVRALIREEIEREAAADPAVGYTLCGEPVPIEPVAYVRKTVRCGSRFRGVFDCRPDVETDPQVVDEVWTANDYRVPASGLSGTVLDIGANIGAFSVLAAKAGAEHVVAVEPERRNLDRLGHHLQVNHVGSATVIAAAVTADGEPAVMAGTGGGAFSCTDTAGAEQQMVDGITLGQLVRNFAPVAFIKMDVEGGEYDAFSSVDANLLHENVEQIALEFHGPGMPHLAHLDHDGGHLARWSGLVAMLADCGRLEIMGHPTVGGLMWWKRY